MNSGGDVIHILLTVLSMQVQFDVNKDATILAVVTHKAGLASGLAHNHLIVASDFEPEISVEEDDLSQLSFRVRFDVADLVVDRPDLQQRWQARLHELGALAADETFSEVSESDRNKITESMLGKKQLEKDKFPTIEASVSGLKKHTNDESWTASLEITIHGVKKVRQISASINIVDGILHIESLTPFKFTDFGIKPYSAAFGAVKNQDKFHLYVSISASKP